MKGVSGAFRSTQTPGVTYSKEVVRRLAAMPCAANDFASSGTNAYSVHHLNPFKADQDQLDIARSMPRSGQPQPLLQKFASTSKVTLPGASISCIAASPDNIAEIKKRMATTVISYDKLNQLRHVRF